MPTTLKPGVTFNVTKAGVQYKPDLLNLNVKVKPKDSTTIAATISFEIKGKINSSDVTFTDAEWATMKDKIVHMAFEVGSSDKIDSETGLRFDIRDMNSGDKRLEIYSDFVITNGKVGGAG